MTAAEAATSGTTTKKNPHAQTIRQAAQRVRELTKDIDTNSASKWTHIGEKQGVKIYKQEIDPKTMDMVRGDVFVKTTKVSHMDFMRILLCGAIRGAWDANMDSAEEKMIYNEREALVWAKYKTPWPVTSRDFCSVCLGENDKNESYVTMISVQDNQIPPVKGCVRGDLRLLGWRIQQKQEGLMVTYINHVDLSGSVPVSVLKMIQNQVPVCAGQAGQYAIKHGYPPYVVKAVQCQFEGDTFDPKKRIYTVTASGGGGGGSSTEINNSRNAELHIAVSRQMYPKGITVKAPSGSSYELENHDNYISVIVKNAKHATVSPK